MSKLQDFYGNKVNILCPNGHELRPEWVCCPLCRGVPIVGNVNTDEQRLDHIEQVLREMAGGKISKTKTTKVTKKNNTGGWFLEKWNRFVEWCNTVTPSHQNQTQHTQAKEIK